MAEKLWLKIGEAAAEVGATPTEIRYWEKKIPEVRPRRSKGNLRYYHRDDLPKLLAIRRWIESGFSAADCRELLLKGCVEQGLGLGGGAEGSSASSDGTDDGWPPEPRARLHKNVQAHEPEPAPALGGEDARKNAKVTPEPPQLPWLESVIDALKEILGRLERPLP